MKKVALDLDDVTFDFNDPLCRWHNRIFGTSYRVEDIKDYDLGKTWGCPKDEAVRRVFQFYDEALSSVTPVPGAISGIEHLTSIGYQLFAPTSRPLIIERQTLESINTYFPRQFEEVVLLDHFGNSGEKVKKSEFCKQRGIDTIVEDATHHAVDCADAGMNVILLTKGWNESFEEYGTIRRVHTWGQVVREIIRLNA